MDTLKSLATSKTSPLIIKLQSSYPTDDTTDVNLADVSSSSKAKSVAMELCPIDTDSDEKSDTAENKTKSKGKVSSKKKSLGSKLRASKKSCKRPSLTSHLSKLSDNKLDSVHGGDMSKPLGSSEPPLAMQPSNLISDDLLDVKYGRGGSDSSVPSKFGKCPFSFKIPEDVVGASEEGPAKKKIKLYDDADDNKVREKSDKFSNSLSPKSNLSCSLSDIKIIKLANIIEGIKEKEESDVISSAHESNSPNSLQKMKFGKLSNLMEGDNLKEESDKLFKLPSHKSLTKKIESKEEGYRVKDESDKLMKSFSHKPEQSSTLSIKKIKLSNFMEDKKVNDKSDILLKSPTSKSERLLKKIKFFDIIKDDEVKKEADELVTFPGLNVNLPLDEAKPFLKEEKDVKEDSNKLLKSPSHLSCTLLKKNDFPKIIDSNEIKHDTNNLIKSPFKLTSELLDNIEENDESGKSLNSVSLNFSLNKTITSNIEGNKIKEESDNLSPSKLDMSNSFPLKKIQIMKDNKVDIMKFPSHKHDLPSSLLPNKITNVDQSKEKSDILLKSPLYNFSIEETKLSNAIEDQVKDESYEPLPFVSLQLNEPSSLLIKKNKTKQSEDKFNESSLSTNFSQCKMKSLNEVEDNLIKKEYVDKLLMFPYKFDLSTEFSNITKYYEVNKESEKQLKSQCFELDISKTVKEDKDESEGLMESAVQLKLSDNLVKENTADSSEVSQVNFSFLLSNQYSGCVNETISESQHLISPSVLQSPITSEKSVIHKLHPESVTNYKSSDDAYDLIIKSKQSETNISHLSKSHEEKFSFTGLTLEDQSSNLTDMFKDSLKKHPVTTLEKSDVGNTKQCSEIKVEPPDLTDINKNVGIDREAGFVASNKRLGFADSLGETFSEDSNNNRTEIQNGTDEPIMEFDILDEFESNENDPDEVNSCSDSEISADEIDAMLEAGLGDYGKQNGEYQHEEKEKVILKVRGRDHFEVLPEGWIEVTHNSGMPIYLHKQSRVCCVSKPYFLGPGSTRKHEIPISAIPCLNYLKQLEKEKEEANKSTNIDSTCKNDVASTDNGISDCNSQESEIKNEESDSTINELESKTNIPPKKDESTSGDAPESTKASNLIFPSAKLESVKEIKMSGSLDYLAVREYCKKRFEFQTITVKRFKTWLGRRRHQKQLKRKQRPFLPDSTQLITCPLPSSADKSTAVGSTSKREFIMNPTGKSPVCILHEYVQHTLRVQPRYIFKELESASTPYGAVVIINDMEYGTGYGSSKKVAKSEAAKSALEVLIPKIKTFAPDKRNDEDGLQDVEFFDQVRVEDPRVCDLSVKAGHPYPYQILLECLKRNYGMGDTEIQIRMKNLKHQKNEFLMRVGKHRASVVCKNKRDGKHRASQAILQQLHPHINSWGSLLRMYGKGSCKTLKEKKEEEQRITELQSKACVNKPNMSILNKLKEEMLKYREKVKSKKPIGKLIPEKMHMLSVSDSNLNNIEL